MNRKLDKRIVFMRKVKLYCSFFVFVLSIIMLSGCRQKENVESDSILQKEMPVKIMEVSAVKDSSRSYYIGTVEELQSVKLSFPVPGNLKNIYFSEGQHVKKGQLLAELDDANYNSMYEVAVAKEKQAQDGYNRLSSVYKNGSLPEVKYVEIETNLEQAKSSLKIAKKNLDDCKLICPIDGVIGKRLIEPGMNAIPDSPVLVVVKIEKVFVMVAVPESEIAHLSLGQKAEIVVTALDSAKYAGIIEQKGVMADALSHTYQVKIKVDNKNEALRPGMVCKVWTNTEGQTEKIIIPQYAVQSGSSGRYVYVIDMKNKKASVRNVSTGSISGDGIIITSGLKAGECIAVAGYQNLFNDAAVIIQ